MVEVLEELDDLLKQRAVRQNIIWNDLACLLLERFDIRDEDYNVGNCVFCRMDKLEPVSNVEGYRSKCTGLDVHTSHTS